MITKDFTIKIIDLGFGINLAGRVRDSFNRTVLGAEVYRPPEMNDKKAYQGQDTDIFSFGVMMLAMSLFCYPFRTASMDDDDYRKLCDQPEFFWPKYEQSNVFSQDFKSLIGLTTAKSPELRIPMADLLGHKWMRGEVIKKEDFAAKYNYIMD